MWDTALGSSALLRFGTEIPEHLRKRAEEARKRAEPSAPLEDDVFTPTDLSRIPKHLLERSRRSREASGLESGPAVPPRGWWLKTTAYRQLMPSQSDVSLNLMWGGVDKQYAQSLVSNERDWSKLVSASERILSDAWQEMGTVAQQLMTGDQDLSELSTALFRLSVFEGPVRGRVREIIGFKPTDDNVSVPKRLLEWSFDIADKIEELFRPVPKKPTRPMTPAERATAERVASLFGYETFERYIVERVLPDVLAGPHFQPYLTERKRETLEAFITEIIDQIGADGFEQFKRSQGYHTPYRGKQRTFEDYLAVFENPVAGTPTEMIDALREISRVKQELIQRVVEEVVVPYDQTVKESYQRPQVE